MNSALVIGASGGLGHAFVNILSSQCDHIYALSRSTLSDDRSHVRHLMYKRFEDCQDHAKQISAEGGVDLIVIAVGALHVGPIMPEKCLSQCNQHAMQALYEANTIAPTLLMQHFLPCLKPSQRSMCIVLSARVGSIEDNRLGGWYSYRAAKAALNMIVKSVAIEHNRTQPNHLVVGVHPGTVDTPLSQPFQRNVPANQLLSAEQSAGDILRMSKSLQIDHSGCLIDRFGQVIPW